MPKKTDAANPADWLSFAESDLEAVQVLSERKAAFGVCRSKLAEALEKLLKADLIHRGWTLRKIHDLQSLLDDLIPYAPATVNSLQPVVDELAEAYAQTRYPGFDLSDENWPRLTELLTHVESYHRRLVASF